MCQILKISIIFLFFLQSNLSAQKIYLNGKWKKTTEDKAQYYRLFDTINPQLFKVQDYFIDGSLQMQGYVSDIKKWERQGQWFWLNTKGDTAAIRHFKDDKQHGQVKVFQASDTLKFIGYHIDGKRDSVWKYFYPNGEFQSTGCYKLGKKEGEWSYYFKRTKNDSLGIYYPLRSKITYREGKKHGSYSEYNPGGFLKSEGAYKEGKKNGISKTYKTWVSHTVTKVKSDTVNDTTTVIHFLVKEENYIDNKKHGKCINYQNDSLISQISYYEHGLRTGEWQLFNNGELFTTIRYEKNRKGEVWSTTGDSLILHVPFKRNRVHGMGSIYYPDSSLQKKIEFNQGYASGTVIKFDTLGIPIDTAMYPKRHHPKPFAVHRSYLSPAKTRLSQRKIKLSAFKAGRRTPPTLYFNYAPRSKQEALVTIAYDRFDMLKDGPDISYYEPELMKEAKDMLQKQKTGRHEIENILDTPLEASVASMLITKELGQYNKINVWAVPISIDSTKSLSATDSVYVNTIGTYFHELTESHLFSEMKITDQNTRWFRDGLAEYMNYRALNTIAPQHDNFQWDDFMGSYEKINCDADLYNWIGTGDKREREGVQGNRGFYDAAFFFFYDLVNQYGDEVLAQTIHRLNNVKRPKKNITGDYILHIMSEITNEDIKARLEWY